MRYAHVGSECLEGTNSSGASAAQSAALIRSWNLTWHCHVDRCSRGSSPKFRLPPCQYCFLLFSMGSHFTSEQMLRYLSTADQRAAAIARGLSGSLWVSAGFHRALIVDVDYPSLNHQGFSAYPLFPLFSSDGRVGHFSCFSVNGTALKEGTSSYLSAMPCWRAQYWWWNRLLGQYRLPWNRPQYSRKCHAAFPPAMTHVQGRDT